MELVPFGEFIVSHDEINPKNFYLIFRSNSGHKYQIILCEKSSEKLQPIADHLNSVVKGKIKPPKPADRRIVR